MLQVMYILCTSLYYWAQGLVIQVDLMSPAMDGIPKKSSGLEDLCGTNKQLFILPQINNRSYYSSGKRNEQWLDD